MSHFVLIQDGGEDEFRRLVGELHRHGLGSTPVGVVVVRTECEEKPPSAPFANLTCHRAGKAGLT
jgi:hypothetical protein